MDRTTVFTKTAKGMMEATGKTSVLSRDMRALLKEIDGKATVGDVRAKLGKVPEATLQDALQALVKNDFIREFKQPQTAAPPPPPPSAAEVDFDLDFTMAIPTVASLAKKAEEEARQKAEAEAQAAARAKAEADARAKQEAAARAKTAAAAAQAAARAKAEAEAKARAEAEARARAEAEARAKREAEERTRKEAEDRVRKEAEEKARREAEELRAKLEEERKAREEAERRAKEEAERERKEVEEKARREADELRARLEEERRAHEEAERKAKEEAERERKEAEERARREADELRARLDEERQAREAAERKAKEEAERREQEEAERKAREDAERRLRDETERKAREDAERARKEAEEKARREADELRARLEDERQAREEAERRAQEEAERRAREDAERQAREEAERRRREAEDAARREAEEQARRQAEERAATQEQERIDAEARARSEAEAQARQQAEQRALAQEQERIEAEARARKETEEAQRRAEEDAARKAQEEAERKARDEAERERREAEEKSTRAIAEQQQAQLKSGPTLEDLVSIETDFGAVLGAGGGAAPDAAKRLAGADDKLRKEAEEQTRLQAEEQASKEDEEQARAQADAEAKRDEEARLRREEEERQQAGPTDAATDLAAVQAREHAEVQALLDAQNAETERHFAEMEKELEAEQAMAGGRIQPSESTEDARAREQEETRERIRAAAAAQAVEAELEAERAPVAYRQRINWGRPVAIGLFLLLVLGVIAVHFVSFDAYIPQFEKLAGAHMQQPVKIKALHLSLVPQPHWRLEGVSVGTEGQLAVPRINAIAELGSMFSEKKVFTSIELESPVLSEDGLLALLFGKAAGQDLKVVNISVKNGKLDSKTFILPALDAKITFGDDGAWRQIALETPDHKTSLLLKPEGEGAQLEVETNAFSLPFHPSFILENLVAKGTIRRGQLRLSEFKGGIYGGYLAGNADLKWGGGWSLGGEISVRAMDPARFTPALMEEGKLEGKAVYAMRAKSYDELFAAPRLEGSFTVLKGTLLGVDLARLLQGGGVGGKTAFTELTGGFVREAGKTQLRQMLLVAGPVSAGGSAEVDAGKHISGRVAVEIKSPVAKARANFTVAGTLKEPRFSRQ